MRYTHLRAKDLVGRLGLVCDGATLAGLKFLTYSLATKLHLQSGHHPRKVRHRQHRLDYRRYLSLLQNPSALNKTVRRQNLVDLKLPELRET